MPSPNNLRKVKDLKIFHPSPYGGHIWHYKHANTDTSSKAMEDFDWDKAFLDKSVDEKTSIRKKNYSQYYK